LQPRDLTQPENQLPAPQKTANANCSPTYTPKTEQQQSNNTLQQLLTSNTTTDISNHNQSTTVVKVERQQSQLLTTITPRLTQPDAQQST